MMKITREELDIFPNNSNMIIAKPNIDFTKEIKDEDILYLGTINEYDCNKEYPQGSLVRIRHYQGTAKEYNLGIED